MQVGDTVKLRSDPPGNRHLWTILKAAERRRDDAEDPARPADAPLTEPGWLCRRDAFGGSDHPIDEVLREADLEPATRTEEATEAGSAEPHP